MLVGDLMQRFCAAEADAYRDLSAPFYKGGWWVATDGRVIVRRRSTATPDTSERGRLPNSQPIFEKIAAVKKWEPWPKAEPCGVCNDNCGRRVVVCEMCMGGGKCTSCRCEREHDCGSCDGTGDAVDLCQCCTIESAVKIGHGHFSQHYVWLVGQLGKVEWGYASKSKRSPLFFRCGDIEGALMGLDTHKEKA